METPRIPSIKNKVHTPPNSFSLSLSSMAQLGQNLCLNKNRKKEKKDGKKEWENKKKEVRCVQMSSNQTHLNNTTSPSFSFSLSLSSNYVPRIALLQAPKKSHLHHWSFKRTIFFTELCGLFGVLCLGQSFTEKTGKREPSYLFPS